MKPPIVAATPAAGCINTQELGRNLVEYFRGDNETLVKEMLNGILHGKPARWRALFLVSDQASPITGQTLNVDDEMAFC